LAVGQLESIRTGCAEFFIFLTIKMAFADSVSKDLAETALTARLVVKVFVNTACEFLDTFASIQLIRRLAGKTLISRPVYSTFVDQSISNTFAHY
jgi:hypothetical protein